MQMMQVEGTETGKCENDQCFVDVPGQETILLKPSESRVVRFDDGTCVEYICTVSAKFARKITAC